MNFSSCIAQGPILPKQVPSTVSGAPAWFKTLAVFVLVVPQQGVYSGSRLHCLQVLQDLQLQPRDSQAFLSVAE